VAIGFDAAAVDAGRLAINGETRLAGVMGWPVAQSRSPRLHNYWLAHYAINGAYVPLPVAPEEFGTAVAGLKAAGFAGVNVTIPHKEAAAALCDELSPEAARAGAANTLIFRGSQGIFGDNTDGYGFIENLRAAQGGFDAAAGPALVVGSGGASRAILLALADAGVPEIRVSNRTDTRAAALARALDVPITVVPWSERQDAADGVALLVNTTSVGMGGDPELPIEPAGLADGALVTDIVYYPLQTPLLAAAQKAGYRVADGLGMLLHQARPGFRAWFGVDPEVTDALHAYVAEGLPWTADRAAGTGGQR